MASFFVPPSQGSSLVSNKTSYLVFENAVLSKRELTLHWYQYLVLGLGSTALFLGLINYALDLAVGKWRNRRIRQHVQRKPWESPISIAKRYSSSIFWRSANVSDVQFTSQTTKLQESRAKLGAAKVFHYFDTSSLQYDLGNPHVLRIVPSIGYVAQRSEHSKTVSVPSLSDISGDGDSNGTRVSCASAQPNGLTKDAGLTLGASKVTGSYRESTSSSVDEYIMSTSPELDGVVLLYDNESSSTTMNQILRNLRRDNILAILLGDADAAVLQSINFGLVDGLILRNACILRSGDRRDYFNSSHVRDCAARCKSQRENRPEFFLGFLEVWDSPPSAATLRRAFKLASYFGAVVEARPTFQQSSSSSSSEMCLGAFDWLKKWQTVDTQRAWTQASPTLDLVEVDTSVIEGLIPGTQRLLESQPLPPKPFLADKERSMTAVSQEYFSGLPSRLNIWDVSSCGAPISLFGCYSLREELTVDQYNQIVDIQRDLKRMSMLHACTDIQMFQISNHLRTLVDRTAYPSLLHRLLDNLLAGTVKIYKGLDSGFSLPDNSGHAWGVSASNQGGLDTEIELYISQKAYDEPATIWHTFLAHHGVPRVDRFQEELLLNTVTVPDLLLPIGIQKDLEASTEAELLSLTAQIKSTSEQHPFLTAILDNCSAILIDHTSRKAWIEMHSKACLDGSIDIRHLLELRLEYFAQLGADRLPNVDNLVEFYSRLEERMEKALFDCDKSVLSSLFAVLFQTYVAGVTPATAIIDLYGLIFFCSLRKLAFEDVYLETTDRCPLFLSQPDQAGVFAELWVLGSQCEIYFGMLPRALGEIIYERYRTELMISPPSPESWDGKSVFTAYSQSEAKVEVEGRPVLTGSGSPIEMPSETPGYKSDEPESTMNFSRAASKFGALSIFCLPAVIDVVLLTFLGRGLYLTAFMDTDSNWRHTTLMANYAIVTALIMTSGVTGWVGSTGGFYLHSFAFDNMVHFMVQRFSAGFVLTTVVAICGLFAFGVQYSWLAGFIFVLYLYPLTIFLNLLGVLATMHREEAPLTSGRSTLWRCIPILFISPILTAFINGWDLLIYMLVIYTFTGILLKSFRNLCHEWTNWSAKIPGSKDEDLLEWYRTSTAQAKATMSLSGSSDISSAARNHLISKIAAFKTSTYFWSSLRNRDEDDFVSAWADGLPFALWILQKESNGNELPKTFTTTWFVQLELALSNQKQLIRGLKEHSAFITYRYSKYDIGQNVGLFLAALLDRFIDLAMSARQPRSFTYYNDRARYALCFGLLYFLCGAVAVDVILQRYWPCATKFSEERLSSLEDYAQVAIKEERLRRLRYRRAVYELLMLLSIVFGITTILLWAFVIDHQGVIIYFTYISAYSGVLLFQFNRCFTKNAPAHVLTILVCVLVGFVVGCILRAVPSTAGLFYNYAIGQNIATTSAAVGTFMLTGYFSNPFRKHESSTKPFISSSAEENREQHDMQALHKGDDCEAAHRIQCEVLQDLCLAVDVDSRWSSLPEDIRRLILGRVLGQAVKITHEAQSWLYENEVNLSWHNERLKMRLARYKHPVVGTDSKLFSAIRSNEIADVDNAEMRQKTALAQRSIDLTQVQEASRSNSAWLSSSTFIIAEAGRNFVGMIASIAKWTAIISAAAPDTQRELWYASRYMKFQPAILWLLLKAWKLAWWSKNTFIHILLFTKKQSFRDFSSLVNRGAPRVVRSDIVTVDMPYWKVTGFMNRDENDRLSLSIYQGLHSEAPAGQAPIALALYDHGHRLYKRHNFSGQSERPTTIIYRYDEAVSKRWPVAQILISSKCALESTYDKYGRIIKGQTMRGGKEFTFGYLYKKRPKGNSEILRATYTCHDTGLLLTVFWCVRPRAGSENVENWISSQKVHRTIAVVDGTTYDIVWNYRHSRDPEIQANRVNADGTSEPCVVPAEIVKDSFGFLRKPTQQNFDCEDILVYYSTTLLSKLARQISCNFSLTSLFSPSGLRSGKVFHQKLSTSALRTALWTSWAKPPFLDAVSACFLDEMILRKEPLLKSYWGLRDVGRLREAAMVLDENIESIMSAIEPSNESSQTCPLIIKSADLFTMGLGKDANQLTARLSDSFNDTENTTSVIFSDNGCWPDNPGGVSNCRRDLINGHTTIRNHCLAESANDFGLPRYQIERNINSLKVLPLWGLDGKTPHHGVIDNLLQTQVDERIIATRFNEDVKEVFIPLLRSFVRGARQKRYTRSDVIAYSNTILNMHKYFERCDFNKTWSSEEVWQAWIEAWLYDYGDSNVNSPSDYFKIEQPSMSHFREALNLYICYLFIYSVEIPAKCPTVFQSTHHGLSSLFGMLLKYRRGTTFGIWDHAILWRETCLNVSPAQCLLPIPVQTMLLAGVKLGCTLAYAHVDIVLPCTSVFNPDWEMDLGTDQGYRGSKKLFARKIDPVVNGIGNMDAFQLVKETRSKLPTTVMLSNVQFIKDVKTAVLAADIIINRYGFSDYRLMIYGAQDRQPSYALETNNMINNRGLSGKVVLAGFGSPKEVLKDAWLFMNSSLSEGLPLAIGEAALSGVPIVATEVGATALVLTDPDDARKRYGEVVPPNDPEALARAQLSVLAMVGPWSQYMPDAGTTASVPPQLPDQFTPGDVERITRRMYEAEPGRKALGLRLREVVLRNFHGQRYLREHEQMYWIQRRRAEIRLSKKKLKVHPPTELMFGERNEFRYEYVIDADEDARASWHEFDKQKLKKSDALRNLKHGIADRGRIVAV